MDKIVFDLETQKDFKEVGGRHNLHLLKISVLGFFSFKENNYYTLEENQISQFEERLKKKPELIGFNIKNFDIQVLKPYLSNVDLDEIKCIDIMDDVVKYLGYRLSLDAIAFGTLNKNKSSQGLQALQWYKSGQIDKVKDYCLTDVKITKEIYEFGLLNGYIKAFAKNNLDIIKIPVSFSQAKQSSANHPLADVFKSKNQLKIKYKIDNPPHNFEELVIEIYNFRGNFIEAFDVLSKKMRLLRFDRIVDKIVLDKKYEIPKSFKTKL